MTVAERIVEETRADPRYHREIGGALRRRLCRHRCVWWGSRGDGRAYVFADGSFALELIGRVFVGYDALDAPTVASLLASPEPEVRELCLLLVRRLP